MAQALGISFLDCDGKEIGFGGGELERIVKIDMSAKEKWLDEADITVMNDVTNPLCGPYGASAVYGPQKGASQNRFSGWTGVTAFGRSCAKRDRHRYVGDAGSRCSREDLVVVWQHLQEQSFSRVSIRYWKWRILNRSSNGQIW